MKIDPVILEGTSVRLEPLAIHHLESLCRYGLDARLWRVTTTLIQTPEEMRHYIETAAGLQRQGSALPFAIIAKTQGEAIGSTRYANIDHTHRRLEIGWTWIGQRWQGTAVNAETKYLLLRHAFESLDCIRVEFKTDALNERSRKALLSIGAKEEGIFRNHMIVPGGRIRNSVYFSIIREEWPGVRSRLEERVAQRIGIPPQSAC